MIVFDEKSFLFTLSKLLMLFSGEFFLCIFVFVMNTHKDLYNMENSRKL